MHLTILIILSVVILVAMFFIGTYGWMLAIFSMGAAANDNNNAIAVIFSFAVALITLAIEILLAYFIWWLWT